MTPRVAILGCGHMGSAIAQRILNDDTLEVSLMVADPDLRTLEKFTQTTALATNDSSVAARNADTIILAVKPHDVQTALESCADHLAGKLIISVAAGVPIERLAAWLPPAAPIVRCIPNTPSLIGTGVTGVFANELVVPAQKEFVDMLLQSLGKVLWLQTEDQLHAVTALSGSGPAYYFYIMDAMIQAGCNLELERDVAEQLAIETAYGASKMVRDTQLAPQTLKAQAATPKGTTITALKSLDKDKVKDAISSAIEAAHTRSVKISEEF